MDATKSSETSSRGINPEMHSLHDVDAKDLNTTVSPWLVFCLSARRRLSRCYNGPMLLSILIHVFQDDSEFGYI